MFHLDQITFFVLYHTGSPGNVSKGLQPETIAMMKWTLSNPFVLSVSLHTGSLVVGYPYAKPGKSNLGTTFFCSFSNSKRKPHKPEVTKSFSNVN